MPGTPLRLQRTEPGFERPVTLASLEPRPGDREKPKEGPDSHRRAGASYVVGPEKPGVEALVAELRRPACSVSPEVAVLVAGMEALERASAIYRQHAKSRSPEVLPEVEGAITGLLESVERLESRLACQSGAAREHVEAQLGASRAVLKKLEGLRETVHAASADLLPVIQDQLRALGLTGAPELADEEEMQGVLDRVGRAHGVSAPRLQEGRERIEAFFAEVAEVRADRKGEASHRLEVARAEDEARLAGVDGDVGKVRALLATGTLEALERARIAAAFIEAAAATEKPGPALDLLAELDPDARAALAQGEPAVLRTLLLKTSMAALPAGSVRTGALAEALAPKDSEGQRRLLEAFGTPGGKALLLDRNISPTARLFALEAVVSGTASEVSAGPKPWTNPAWLNRYAEQRFAVFEERPQSGRLEGTHLENFLGAAFGRPVRTDLSSDAAALDAAIAAGRYDLFRGDPAVSTVAAAVRAAAMEMGGGDPRLEPIPILFSTDDSGPVEMLIFRVYGPNGNSRIVDPDGRIYPSEEAWRKETSLPAGTVTYPAASGYLTERTPAHPWQAAIDTTVTIAGVIGSGILIFGSGGTATPLVSAAWGLTLGSAGYGAASAAASLEDRHRHGQTLSLADPDARAAWLSLAAGGLPAAGAGVAKGGRVLALSKDVVARTQGAVNAATIQRRAPCLQTTRSSSCSRYWSAKSDGPERAPGRKPSTTGFSLPTAGSTGMVLRLAHEESSYPTA